MDRSSSIEARSTVKWKTGGGEIKRPAAQDQRRQLQVRLLPKEEAVKQGGEDGAWRRQVEDAARHMARVGWGTKLCQLDQKIVQMALRVWFVGTTAMPI